MDHETIITIICVFCALAILAVSFWTPMMDYLAERRAKKALAEIHGITALKAHMSNRLRYFFRLLSTTDLISYSRSLTPTFHDDFFVSEECASLIAQEIIRERNVATFRAKHELGPECEWDDVTQTLFRIEYPEVSA